MKTVEIKCDMCKEVISKEVNYNENEKINRITIGNEIIISECCDNCIRNIKDYIEKQKAEKEDKNNFNFERE